MTIVEVIVAVILLATAALVTVGLFATLSRADRGSQFSNIALLRGQEKMDQLLRTGASLGSTPLVEPVDALPEGTRTWFAQPDSARPDKLQDVTVLVSWRENGRSRTVQLDTLVAK